MTLADTDFTFVTGMVRQRSSIDLQPGKEYLVESRLAPVARKFGDKDLTALVHRLRRNDREACDAVVDALTTNETSFFRDQHPFDAFSNLMLPELKRNGGPTVNVWSAASSSGQEAYSLALLLLDWLPMNPGKTARIHGTDISPTMVARATAGKFSQLEINRGMPVKYLVKYFDQVGRDWIVKPEVRALTSFRQGNLAMPPVGLPPIDIVFLRNVLIYFDLPTKRQVLANVRKALKPGGFLVLGGAESTLSLDGNFARVETEKVVIFRNGGGT
ncbi:protein-glutamate O-methyltransferase CheR [Kineosporia rhizophila]|uniref:CheR family methyltransferase n=1 Tax=Kineosporia TaxID=49184 RepID=UPI001E53ACB7|nr:MULTISPECIES: protein-glutamate O-methyltransferase CheR [Kineosporia]MCE0534445.1 protein-glutamate O-methyltransferase CheR [Kineosporia rhizophila]GLY13979.1 chemotaxis protein methyltransferase [Kineosporia sp. NBRC 101677]